MNWFILLIAGLFEIGWAIGLKYSEGYTKLWPTVGTVICLIASFVLLGLAMKNLPVGTAYAVWVGIGACSTAIYGIWRFSEDASPARIAFLALLIVALVGLKVTSD